MSLVCFASFKGSPGTTLTALAAAAAWPSINGRRKLLLEADADGGSLALMYQLPAKPGLLSLSASARHGLAREQLWDHAQQLPGGLPVVLGPEGPEQATEVLRSNGRALGEWLSSLDDVDIIADVGRLSLGSAAFELARCADAVLAVARPVATELQPAAQRLTSLVPYGPRLGWVLVGEKPYSAQAVAEAYGFPVVHVVADDERGAKLLQSGTSPRKLRRTTLVRSVVGLSEVLAGWLHPEAARDKSADGSSATPSPPTSSTAAVVAPPPVEESRVDVPAPAKVTQPSTAAAPLSHAVPGHTTLPSPPARSPEAPPSDGGSGPESSGAGRAIDPEWPPPPDHSAERGDTALPVGADPTATLMLSSRSPHRPALPPDTDPPADIELPADIEPPANGEEPTKGEETPAGVEAAAGIDPPADIDPQAEIEPPSDGPDPAVEIDPPAEIEPPADGAAEPEQVANGDDADQESEVALAGWVAPPPEALEAAWVEPAFDPQAVELGEETIVDPASIPAPSPDARRPPSLAIIAARRGREMTGKLDDEAANGSTEDKS